MTAYSATEIIDIAKQIEACGEAFYDEVAEKHLDQPETHKIFVYLSREESRHADVFESLLKKLDLSSGDWRLNEEYLGYLRILAENRVFPDQTAAREKVTYLPDASAAVRFAIGYEKDTILFFHELRPVVGKNDEAIIDRLIAEEQKHVVTLNVLLAALEGEGK